MQWTVMEVSIQSYFIKLFLFGRLTTKDTMVVINKFSSHCGDFSSNVLDHWFHEILMFSNLQKQ